MTLHEFRDIEWSLGEGQCPDCLGWEPDGELHIQWRRSLKAPTIGHHPNCPLEAAIKELSGE